MEIFPLSFKPSYILIFYSYVQFILAQLYLSWQRGKDLQKRSNTI